MGDPSQILRPLEIDGLPRDDSRQLPLSEALAWMRDFLAHDNPRIGRIGPVCPFVPRALTNQTLWSAVDDSRTPPEVEVAMHEYADEFERLIGELGVDAQFASLVVVFRRITAADAPAAIDAVQRALKVEFVERGFMIGEFHAANETPAASPLAEQGFFPNRAPLSMLAIRTLAPNDRKFLKGEGFSRRDRLRLKRGYLRDQLRRAPNERVREIFGELLDELDDLIAEL